MLYLLEWTVGIINEEYTANKNGKLLIMKKLLITSLLVLIVSVVGYSQAYRTGIGVRLGNSNGVTVKHFISNQGALEGILSTRWGGFNFTGMYEHQYQIGSVQNFYWFIGAGGHAGVWDGDPNPWFEDNNDHVVIGADGIIGMEYTLKNAPLNFGLDWKPSINLIEDTGFWGDEFGLSVRFAIK